MAVTVTPNIARLLVQLDDVSPAIRRRIEVPLNMRLDRLHWVMQIVMGWEDCHLYEFRVGRSISYGEPDPDWDFAESSRLPASGASLGDLLARIPGKSKKFTYVYDFGDNWRHTVKLEALVAAEAGATYPRLISAERACPPEDVGGPWVMRTISLPLVTRLTRAMPRCSNGAAKGLTPPASMWSRSNEISRRLPSAPQGD